MRSLAACPILAHHDDGRLDGGEAGEDEIEKNEWIGVKGFGHQVNDVDENPNEDEAEEEDDEGPTATELGDVVGEAVAEGDFLVEVALDFGRDEFVGVQAGEDFFFQGSQVTGFVF